MPYAIFHKSFDYDHRPHKAVCQHIKASETPQSWPEKIIDAAVAAGCAERVDYPSSVTADEAPAPAARRKKPRIKASEK